MPKATKQKPNIPSKKKAGRISRIKGSLTKTAVKNRIRSRRVRKVETRRSHQKITGSFRLFADVTSLLRQHWKLFGSFVLIYIILSVALIGVRGSNLQIGQLKKEMDASYVGAGQVGFDLALFGMLVGSSTSSSSASGSSYQPIVFLIVSLATIWALRQLMAGKKIGIRDAFYKGMFPLVPVSIVIFFIGLQLLPATLGAFLFGVTISSGLAVGMLETAFWATITFLLMLISIYLICSSLFAFYIVTLPNMRPLAALRSARNLVRFRRWTIIRKLLFLPFSLLLIGAVLTLPFIWFWPVAAQWVFLLLSMGGLVFAHAYLYSLYRELL